MNMLKARLKAAEDLMAAQADELSTVRNALYDATTKQRQLENEIAGHKQQDKHFRYNLHASCCENAAKQLFIFSEPFYQTFVRKWTNSLCRRAYLR